jgi:spore coat polysaccharide biosynthesis predicted glycosyltransferase SpsG
MPKYSNISFNFVLGRSNSNIDELLSKYQAGNVNIFYDVYNMPEIMIRSDIAITARGRTGYELAILGIPTISIAQNTREEKHDFISSANGFFYLGLNPEDSTIESSLDLFINMSVNERMRYQKTLLSHNLKNGRKHVMNLINDLFD